MGPGADHGSHRAARRGGTSARGNVVPGLQGLQHRKKGMLPVEWQEYVASLGERHT